MAGLKPGATTVGCRCPGLLRAGGPASTGEHRNKNQSRDKTSDVRQIGDPSGFGCVGDGAQVIDELDQNPEAEHERRGNGHDSASREDPHPIPWKPGLRGDTKQEKCRKDRPYVLTDSIHSIIVSWISL